MPCGLCCVCTWSTSWAGARSDGGSQRPRVTWVRAPLSERCLPDITPRARGSVRSAAGRPLWAASRVLPGVAVPLLVVSPRPKGRGRRLTPHGPGARHRGVHSDSWPAEKHLVFVATWAQVPGLARASRGHGQSAVGPATADGGVCRVSWSPGWGFQRRPCALGPTLGRASSSLAGRRRSLASRKLLSALPYSHACLRGLSEIFPLSHGQTPRQTWSLLWAEGVPPKSRVELPPQSDGYGRGTLGGDQAR